MKKGFEFTLMVVGKKMFHSSSQQILAYVERGVKVNTASTIVRRRLASESSSGL